MDTAQCRSFKDEEDAKGKCTICHETPDELNLATVPSCGHSFCAGCIVSWGAVRGLCALCRAPFTSVFVRRALDGTVQEQPTLEPVTLLRRASWVSAVTVTPDVDTFAPPPADLQPLPPEPSNLISTASSSAAPYYRDERVEDELEEMFWEEEERNYRELSRRTVGNRPFGANGFLSSGRQVARAPQLTRRQKAAAAAAAAAASSSSQAPARRKKKVKKNSRAARMAARAEGNSGGNYHTGQDQDRNNGL